MPPTMVAGIAGSVLAAVVVAIVVVVLVLVVIRSKTSPKVHDRAHKKRVGEKHDGGGETTGQSGADTRTKLARTRTRECWGAHS